MGGWPQAGQWVTVAPERGAGLLKDDHTLCSKADPVSPDWRYPQAASRRQHILAAWSSEGRLRLEAGLRVISCG